MLLCIGIILIQSCTDLFYLGSKIGVHLAIKLIYIWLKFLGPGGTFGAIKAGYVHILTGQDLLVSS